MKTKLTRVGTLFLAILTMSSCDLTYFDGEIQEISWDGALAAPIGYVEYSVSELLEDVSSDDLEISSNDQGVITFLYNQEVESQGFGEAIEIDNQSFVIDLELPEEDFALPVAITETQEFFKELYIAPFSENNEELTKAFFDGGTIQITAKTNINSQSNIAVELPTFISTLDDSPLSFSASFDGSSNTEVVRVFDLSDFYGDFTKTVSGEASYNTILMDISIELIRQIGDQFGPGSYFEFSVLLNGVETTLIYGDFKTQTISMDATSLEFDAFDAFGDGELLFADPVISMTFENSFGIPMGIDLSGISALGADGTIRLEGPITDNLQDINAPAIGAEGTSVSSLIEINNTNSNISDLISSKPSEFIVDLTVYTNPNDMDPNENFLDSNSEIQASVQVEIPMAVTFENIPMDQVIDFDLGSDLDNLSDLRINIHSTNTMPMGGSVVLEFLDGTDTVLFATDSIDMFSPAPVDAEGKSSGAAEDSAVVEFDQGDVNLMSSAKSIRVTAYLNTTDAAADQVVMLLDSDSLRIDLSALIKINL